MTNRITEGERELWRISENPPDGLNPFRFRLLGGEGRETRPIAMFMHLTDIENVIADHTALRDAREALEQAMRDFLDLQRISEAEYEVTAYQNQDVYNAAGYGGQRIAKVLAALKPASGSRA